MRVNLHDFSGHPFQVQLSRELAGRGHEVVHTYAAQYVSGRGRLTVSAQDPGTLRIEALRTTRPLIKYSPLARIRFERGYAEAWKTMLERESFDLVVACNVPLFALARMRRYFMERRQRWLLWHQDLYSLGVSAEAKRRLPAPVSGLASRYAQSRERAQISDADAVVAITEAMIEQYRRWGLPTGHATVIPNWAPLGDSTPGPRNNGWAAQHALPPDALRLLYAGTLGRKHNPHLLLDLLDAVRAEGRDAVLIVASEGEGADELAAAAGDRSDVLLLGFQPDEHFSDMLSSADVMVALLEPEASHFSVPSKVLSYLSAGRPTIALMPRDNPAAADVLAAGGFVGEPNRRDAAAAGRWLVGTAARDGELSRLGGRARQLAETRFDIRRIADRFENVFEQVGARGMLTSVGTASDVRERQFGS